MRRGSTPIVAITVNDQIFDGCTVVVTIDQDGIQVTKSNRSSNDLRIEKNYDDDGNVTGSTIYVYLTQKDTLNYDVGVVRVQIRWIDILGNAFVSKTNSLKLDEVLLEREIRYGE